MMPLKKKKIYITVAQNVFLVLTHFLSFQDDIILRNMIYFIYFQVVGWSCLLLSWSNNNVENIVHMQHIGFRVWHVLTLYKPVYITECQKGIHFKTQPGPVAKNATPRMQLQQWTRQSHCI